MSPPLPMGTTKQLAQKNAVRMHWNVFPVSETSNTAGTRVRTSPFKGEQDQSCVLKKAPMKQVSADDIKQYINALTADSFEQRAVSCCGCSSTYATPQGLQKHLKGHGAADEDLKPLLDNHEVDPVHQVGHKEFSRLPPPFLN